MQKRLALITGASGGLGEAFAHVLAEEGWDLVIVARRDGELHRVAGVLTERHQVSVTPIVMDLTAPDACSRLAADVAARGMEPEVVINNAGFGLNGRAIDLPREEQVNMVDLNCRAVCDLTLRFLPSMVAKRTGGVLNVSSEAGFLPGPYMATYFATKAFIVSFTEGLAMELKGTGVTACVFCPGPIRTGFQARSHMEDSRLLRFAKIMKAEPAVRAGWDGFKRGRVVVAPNALDTFNILASRFLPHWMTGPFTRFLLTPRDPAYTLPPATLKREDLAG